MVKMYPVLFFVLVVCAASIGFVLLATPQPAAPAVGLDIPEGPVALGPETVFNPDLELLCDGAGTIEVTPYRSGYFTGESVMFTAHAMDGWKFDHWEGPLVGDGLVTSPVKVRMPGGAVTIKAVFLEE